MEKQRRLKQQRKVYLREEKESIRRQKKELSKRTSLMRSQIRRDILRMLKERFMKFLREPIKIKKLSKEERALRQAIKEDIRRGRREKIQQLPQLFSTSIEGTVKRRRLRLQRFFIGFRESFSGITMIKNNRLMQAELFRTLVNSLALFTLAFFIAYFLNQLVTVLTAKLYDIPAILYSYRIFWPLYTYSSLYTRQALIVIFAAGPFLSLGFALLLYRIFSWVRSKNTNFKILIIWMIFHSVNLFFGAYISGVITRTGFIYTTEWIFYSQVFAIEEIIFMIVSFVALIMTGYFLTPQFIYGANSPALIELRVRIFYIMAQVLIPWIVGLTALVLLNYPRNPPELIIVYATTVLMIIPMLINFNSPDNQAIRLESGIRRVHIGWIYMILLAAFAFIIRRVVYYGLNFY